MIAIISSVTRERLALAALCEQRQWSILPCDSIRTFRRTLIHSAPSVVLVRSKLSDGYCDQIWRFPLQGARVIVLVAAGTNSTAEARLVAMGADCVLRDPVRTDVLVEYMAKYLSRREGPPGKRPIPPKEVSCAGLRVDLVNRRVFGKTQNIKLTPREVSLVQFLVEAEGEVVTYEILYNDILGRPFQGDTSNMRVLLQKLADSWRKAGIDLRDWIDVIPKKGYVYSGSRANGGKRTG